MKQLLLCRHAKSSWKNRNLPDIDRPLNKRGRKNAPDMGRRLAERGMEPEQIFTSPAKRARKTARRLCRGMGASRSIIRVVDSIYDSDVQNLLNVLMKTDERLQRILLVGHNFELTDLVNTLLALDIYNVPTCGIVAIQFDCRYWNEISRSRAELLFFDYPGKTGL
jgi:phosphohistidine phosphatase